MNNRRRMMLPVLFAGALALPSAAHGQRADEDRKAIRSAFQEWVRVAEAGDVDAYMTFVTDGPCADRAALSGRSAARTRRRCAP